MTVDVRALLDEADRLANATVGGAGDVSRAEKGFREFAQSFVPAAARAIRAVLDLAEHLSEIAGERVDPASTAFRVAADSITLALSALTGQED